MTNQANDESRELDAKLDRVAGYVAELTRHLRDAADPLDGPGLDRLAADLGVRLVG